MPSRNILHGRGVGFKSRIRGTGLVGRFGALAAEWLRLRVRAGSAYAPCYLGRRIIRIIRIINQS